ncbi:MAG: hypothetical protein ACRD0J_02885, partial [Acidimicrobiales bacterium]
MAVLVLLEGVAIALLGLLVVGLLRSHADILATLHRMGAGPDGGPGGAVNAGAGAGAGADGAGPWGGAGSGAGV